MRLAPHTWHSPSFLKKNNNNNDNTHTLTPAGGLAKQFAVPGWRVGWILLHDPLRRLSSASGPAAISVKQGLKNMTQLIIGANTLCQTVIPRLFPTSAPTTPPCPSPADQRSRSGSATSTEDSADEEGPEMATTAATTTTTDDGDDAAGAGAEALLAAYHRRYVGTLEANARFLVAAVAGDPRLEGRLSVRMPQGAMYAMVKLEAGGGLRDGLDRDDVAFCARLLQEENVVLLPGQAFGVAGYVRVVVAPPREMLAEAVARLGAFVERHAG